MIKSSEHILVIEQREKGEQVTIFEVMVLRNVTTVQVNFECGALNNATGPYTKVQHRRQ